MASWGLGKQLQSAVVGASDERTQDRRTAAEPDKHARPLGSWRGTHSPSRLCWPDPPPSGPGRCPPSDLDPHLKNTQEHRDVENPSHMSGGMKNGAAVVENSWLFLRKLDTGSPCDPAPPLLGVPPEDVRAGACQAPGRNVHSSVSTAARKWEGPVSIRRGGDKQNVVCVHNGKVPGLQQEGDSNTHYSMDHPRHMMPSQ